MRRTGPRPGRATTGGSALLASTTEAAIAGLGEAAYAAELDRGRTAPHDTIAEILDAPGGVAARNR